MNCIVRNELLDLIKEFTYVTRKITVQCLFAREVFRVLGPFERRITTVCDYVPRTNYCVILPCYRN